MRYLKEGKGWRLGYDPDAIVFKGLVGGDRWAIELSEAEFADFCRLAQELDATLQAMAAELMPEERIECEKETPLLWMEVEGFPGNYGLRIILSEGRRCEGAWPPATASQVVAAIPSLSLF